MTTLERIKSPVEAELARYEDYLCDALRSDGRLTQQMLDYVMSTRGKAVRPLMVMLSAGIYGGGDDSYLAAMLVEMLHTATLVHDDVIDHAALRRGKPSVAAMWQSQRAVLIGDFILAKSFSLGMASGRYEIVEYITRCMTSLCEGELLQSEAGDTLAMTRPLYDRIIYNKTATLIGTSCGVGAMAAGASPADVATMKETGDAAGMAFQIKDDILDYSPSADTGKPLCGDLRERKITLPLLSVLEKSPEPRRREIIGMLTDGRVDELHDIVVSEGGLAMAAAAMDGYVERAISTLTAHTPPSPHRDALAQLFRYIADRER